MTRWRGRVKRFEKATSLGITNWFWRWGVRYTPLAYGPFLRFTILGTFIVFVVIEVAARQLQEPFALLLRTAGLLLAVLAVLYIQNLILVAVFVRSFPRFIERLSHLHFVTRAFGVELLRQFLSADFDPIIFTTPNVASLPAALQSLESPEGCILSRRAYALLLQKSSDYRPSCVWATWDDEAFPIRAVFDPVTKKTKMPYSMYFDSLAHIYEQMPTSVERIRVFVFKDVAAQNSIVVNSREWDAVCDLHKAWKFETIWYCTADVLEQTRTTVGIKALTAIDDIVYFRDARDDDSGWIVGIDRTSERAMIRKEDLEVVNIQQFFNLLKDQSTPFDLTTHMSAAALP
jgi:hypothetical protein